MKPGTYVLSHDFLSPTPDQRFKNDWRRWPTIMAGTIFHVRKTKAFDEAFTGPFAANCVNNGEKSPWRNLFPFLKPVADTPTRLLTRRYAGGQAGKVLDILYAKGKFTITEVAEAIEQSEKSRGPG